MKRTTFILMALAMVLGLAQCKKEQPEPQSQNEGRQVTITLNAGSSTGSGTNGSRVSVNPNGSPMVSFEDGDKIFVGSGGVYVGVLTRQNGVFTGTLTNPTEGQPLYFYFFGNKIREDQLEIGNQFCPPVDISDQTEELPVLSIGASTENYSTSITSYSSVLQNKCSLMKFDVTTPSNAAICITGMCNRVTVSFADGENTMGQGIDVERIGLIKMKGVTGGHGETWAIVLPQSALEEGAEGSLYTADGCYSGKRPAIREIKYSEIYTGEENTVSMTATTDTYNALTTPLTFEAKTAGAQVSFNINTHVVTDPNSVEYSLNGGEWKTYTSNTPITLTHVGDKVMFRGANDNYSVNYNSDAHSKFVCTQPCYVYGNVMSLINMNYFASATTIPESTNVSYYGSGDNASALQGLFYNNTNIDIPASRDLVLPATTLKDNCYAEMFEGCTSLTKAPALPATSLASSCYNNMFKDCTSLATAPALPATTLAVSCYSQMFSGCTSLNATPVLPAKTLEGYCYNWMFGGCTNLNTVTCLATNHTATNCTQGWLSGVASSGTFYKDSGTSWYIGNADNVPTGWTVTNYVEPSK